MVSHARLFAKRYRLNEVSSETDEEPEFLDAARALRLAVQGILSTRMTRDTYDGLDELIDFGFPVPDDTFTTRYRVEAALETEAKISTKEIDCCVRGCVLFYGKRAMDRQCLCGEDRYREGVSNGITACLIVIH